MKVALCCIGRLENQYAVEYVEHYKKLGFNKIFIYDNNHDGEEHFEDVLQSFIDDGFVEVINYRNKETAQLSAYNDCYQKHSNEYDWIAFYDFDEFLILEKNENIVSFLSQDIFNKYQCILINWMIMDDNDIIYNDNKPLMERFTHPMDYDKHVAYSFPENNHIKSIVKGGIDNLSFNSTPHVPSANLLCCDAIGNGCDSSPFKKYDFRGAYLKHFFGKTIEEWVNYKMRRGASDRTYESSKKTYNIEKFFTINEKTEEKINFVKMCLTEKQNISIFICTHKYFEPIVTSDVYKIISTKKIDFNTKLSYKICDKVNLPLSDLFFSELYSCKYVYDNMELPKYIGFCHYRRYFNFLDNVPDIDEIFSQYDAVVTKPIIFNTSIKEHYKNFHNIEDIDIVEKIIDEKYKEYSDAFKSFSKGKIFIPYNMFIMKSEDFKKYCEFIFGVLNEYLSITGYDIFKRIVDNKDKYLKDFYPNNTIEYQYRIGGYIGERLTNVFILNNFKKLKTFPIVITEEKYKQ